MLIAGLMLASTIQAVERTTKLEPIFNATMWGAGIGMVLGLSISALSPDKDDTEAEEWAKIRNRTVRGTSLGAIIGLVFGIIEVNSNSGFSSYVIPDKYVDQIVLAYNAKF